MNDLILASERALMRLALEHAWLFESADDEALDLDTAVNWLEGLAHGLDGLPNDAKLRLIDVAAELAAEHRGRGSTEGAEFFDSCPETLGFGSSSAEGET